MGRISIAATLGWVVAFALGLAALVNASDFWAGATLLLTLAALFGSVLGTILRGWRGGGWLGFSVFGWGYFLLLLMPGLGDQIRWLSDFPVTWVFERANPIPGLPSGSMSVQPMPPSIYLPPPPIPPTAPPAPSSEPGTLGPVGMPSTPSVGVQGVELSRPSLLPDPNTDRMAAWERRSERFEKAKAIGHWLSTLVCAGFGAILGVLLARGRPAGITSPPLT